MNRSRLMSEFKKPSICFCVALALCIFSLKSQAKTNRQFPILTLQWEVSQPTGQHQMSLVFKEDRVDMFTNTAFWQGALSPRLGHFTSAWSEVWQVKRERIDIYLSLLKASQSTPRENLPEGIMELIQESPHAPVIRLNGYEIGEGDSYFSVLEDIFPSIWKHHQWSCIDCAIYKKLRFKRGIERQRTFKNGNTDKKIFSREEMKCYSVNRKLLECTDTHNGPTGSGWGSFRISL